MAYEAERLFRLARAVAWMAAGSADATVGRLGADMVARAKAVRLAEESDADLIAAHDGGPRPIYPAFPSEAARRRSMAFIGLHSADWPA
jgi:hypothetical protein